jgi:hypothetical protein
MKIFYYHNSSQRIVYTYEPGKFDIDFFVPNCRIAYSDDKQDINVRAFYYGWSNGIFTGNINDDVLRGELNFLYHKCSAMHYVIRISSIMKHELLQPTNNFQFKFEYDHKMNNEWLQEFYKTNASHCEKEFNKKLNYHIGRLQLAETLDEVKSHFKDFWVSTKHVDGYSYSSLNVNL